MCVKNLTKLFLTKKNQKIMILKKAMLFVFVFLLGLSQSSFGQTLLTHHFNDGDYGGFEIPKTDQESRVNIVNKRVETHWQESLYNNTNSGRKAQIRPDDNAYHFTQEFWTGYWLKIHSDYMSTNTNTQACLMQIWGHNDTTGSANWYSMLKFDGRNGGALTWQHRYNSVTATKQALVYPNFPKDTFVRVVIRLKLGALGDGIVQIWIDDELRLSLFDQTIGWGDMNSTGMYNNTYSSISYGQYNITPDAAYADTYDEDDHYFDGYEAGETRTVTYDKVSLWNGSNGYATVHPQGSSAPDDNFNIIKRNATGYGLDGGSGGSNGQNVSLHSSTSHANLTWTEINRGDGYYSYQKLNTNYCLDGGDGGANNQNLELQENDETNYDQQWEKVDVGDGYYRIQKRSASGYSINGGSGGFNGKNVTIYANANSQNMQWRFDVSSNTFSKSLDSEPKTEKSIEELKEIEQVNVYPNPVSNLLNVSIPVLTYNNYTLRNVNSQIIEEGTVGIDVTAFSIDVSSLPIGVYILSLKGLEKTKMVKVVKK